MLIDTSGWLCLMDDRDRRHREALRHFDSAYVRFTHSYILAELVPLSYKRGYPRVHALEFVDNLIDDPTINVAWVNYEFTKRANDLLRARLDKKWSLCDAVSFLLMRDEGIFEALSTDHHFEQAGFVKLLES